MKKRNFKTRLIAISASILSAALIQACGSSSSAAPIVTTGSGSVVDTVTGPLNSGLYQACTAGTGNYTIAQEIDEEYGVELQSAIQTTSPDGTPVCQVVMETEASGTGYRAFLGPDASDSEGESTGISLAAYDVAIITAQGDWSSGYFANPEECSGTSIQDDGDVYGYVYGANLFPLGNTPVSIGEFAGGTLYVGLNQSPGEEGCMALEVMAQIQRCVDVSGNTHQCPSNTL